MCGGGGSTPDDANRPDAEGRLASVDSGSTRKFVYNALGERAEWISSGGSDQHLFDPSGTWLGNAGEYSTLPALGIYRALYINGEAVYLHRNNLGSSQTQTDYSGTPIQDMAFYPWGQVWWQARQGMGWGFAGMPYWDVNTNTSFTQFREYSMNVGRWYSPDPLGGEVINPQSLNRYAYAMNNPTTYNDPLGLTEQVPPGCDPSDPEACGPPPCNPFTDIECNPGCSIGNPDCTPGCGALGIGFPCGPTGPPGGIHVGGGGGGGGTASSAPPAGQPPLANGGTNFSPTDTLPIGELGLCVSQPEVCTAVTIIVVVSAAYEGYQLWKHTRPLPAQPQASPQVKPTTVPQAPAQTQSQPNTDWEICYLRSDLLRGSGFHTCYYVCQPSKRVLKRVQKDTCDPYTTSF